MAGVLEGRTLAVIDDLSLDERVWLHEQTRLFKEMHTRADATGDWSEINRIFGINNPSMGLYTVFLEKSTRTKHSTINAAKRLGIPVTELKPEESSLEKGESFARTFRQLYGYDNHFFAVRSTFEGVCHWLAIDAAKYARRHHIRTPIFINAGDGKHEHPPQELLDEFTFWEHNGFNWDHLHVALIGDLLNGRTVHSKADGLKVFREVEVDLVAPEQLALPAHYVERMRDNGFQVRIFGSIPEYLGERHRAKTWYMTRDQLERADASLLPFIPMMRRATKLQEEDIERLPEGVMLFHPLPMNKEWPEAPMKIEDTPREGWNLQSHNGYLSRFVLLSALAGRIGHDFRGQVWTPPTFDYDFITEAPAGGEGKDDADHVKPIENGIMIDHISVGETDPDKIHDDVYRVVKISGISKNKRVLSGPTESIKTGIPKGYIFARDYEGPLTERDLLDPENHAMHQLAALAPGCTVNVIRDGVVVRKVRVGEPPKVFDYQQIECSNRPCISRPEHKEPGIKPSFTRSGHLYLCDFCDTPHTYRQLWKR